MENFFDMVKENASIERKPLMEGRNMIMVLAPQCKLTERRGLACPK